MAFDVAPWISRKCYFIAYFVFRNHYCRFLSSVTRCSNNPTGLEGPRCLADWVRGGFYSGHFSNPLRSPSPHHVYFLVRLHSNHPLSILSSVTRSTPPCCKGGVGCSTRTNEMCGIPVIYVKETRKGGISATNNTGSSRKFFRPIFYWRLFFISTSTSPQLRRSARVIHLRPSEETSWWCRNFGPNSNILQDFAYTTPYSHTKSLNVTCLEYKRVSFCRKNIHVHFFSWRSDSALWNTMAVTHSLQQQKVCTLPREWIYEFYTLLTVNNGYFSNSAH
jgi:hypothetical protein